MGLRNRFGYALAVGGVLIALVVSSVLLYRLMLASSFDLPAGFLRLSTGVLFGFLVALIVRYVLLLWFSYLSFLDESRSSAAGSACPLVSILVPSYNEAPVIQGSIRSLLKLDYPRYEILVIDDGSTDDTYFRAAVFDGRHGGAEVRVLHKRNGGKADALNLGIEQARGSLVLCMDGDSTLAPGTLRCAAPIFDDPAVGAVAGNVKVVNRTTMLSRLQALEYIEGLNMVRQAQAFFRAVNIVPGPIGLFRRSALRELGGYASDTFAEDCDLTLRLLARGWQVRYQPLAVAHTEAPEGLLDLLKQRYRWTRGILQAIRKHAIALVDPRGRWTLCLTLWYMLFEGVAWPVLNVFAHVLFVVLAAGYGASLPLVVWWAQLTVLDLAAALYCVAIEEESLALVPYAVLYRAFFALTIDVSKLFATVEELLRLRMDWGKLERMGRI
ncbi:MAG: glycosyltransferase [Myxococcota bacterium]